MTLAEITTQLEAISLNPCACNVCKHAAKRARDALIAVSPLGERLLQTAQRDSDEFRALETRFRNEELDRLTSALFYLKRGKCMMQQSPHAAPAAPEIPKLPYDDAMNNAVERYKKFAASHRKRRIEYQKDPKIPGAYLIK